MIKRTQFPPNPYGLDWETPCGFCEVSVRRSDWDITSWVTVTSIIVKPLTQSSVLYQTSHHQRCHKPNQTAPLGGAIVVEVLKFKDLARRHTH